MAILPVSSVNFNGTTNNLSFKSRNDKNVSEKHSMTAPSIGKAAPVVVLMAMNPSLLNSAATAVENFEEDTPVKIELVEPRTIDVVDDALTYQISPEIDEVEQSYPLGIAYFNKAKIQTLHRAIGNGVKGKLVFTAPRGTQTNEVTNVYFIKDTYKDSNDMHFPPRITGLVYHDTGDGKEFLGIELIEAIYDKKEDISPCAYMDREVKLDDESAQYIIDFLTNDTKWNNKTDIKYSETKNPSVKYPATY